MTDSVEELTAPYLKFKTYLLENGIKHKEIADIINVKPSTFSNKINKIGSNFSLDEASLICSVLDIDMSEYFFNDKFSKMRNEVN